MRATITILHGKNVTIQANNVVIGLMFSLFSSAVIFTNQIYLYEVDKSSADLKLSHTSFNGSHNEVQCSYANNFVESGTKSGPGKYISHFMQLSV